MLADPFSRRCPHRNGELVLAVGKRPQFLSAQALHRLLTCPQVVVSGFTHSKQSEDGKAKAATSFMIAPWMAHSTISANALLSVRLSPIHCGR